LFRYRLSPETFGYTFVYSSDCPVLAACEFHLFVALKEYMRGRNLEHNKQVQQPIRYFLRKLWNIPHADRFTRFVQRWKMSGFGE